MFKLLSASGIASSRAADAPRVILIGLDGADYTLVQALAERGDLPALSSIAQRGVFGPLTSLTAEPSGPAAMQWASVATGQRVDVHGVVGDYLRWSADGAYSGPFQSGMWRAPAIWHVLSESGLRVGVAGWPATWPARAVNGLMASHYVKYRAANFSYEATVRNELQLTMTGSFYDVADLAQTHPGGFFEEVRPMVRRAEGLPDEAMLEAIPTAASTPENVFYDLKWNFVANEITRDLALRLVGDRSLDFVAVVLHGIDVAFHRGRKLVSLDPFGNIPHPTRGAVTDEYYRYVDAILAELVAAAGEGAIVIVLSEHGTVGGRHSHMAIDGIIAAAGPGIAAGGRVEGATLLDVFPTLLYALDQPVPTGLPGRVLAVSHFYHLPRIKLSYQRQGLEAYTVPARESRWIPKTPYTVGREVLALWFYYVRG